MNGHDAHLFEKLSHDAEMCKGKERCQATLMHCAFGPAMHCDEYAALFLRTLDGIDALRANLDESVEMTDALLAEHDAFVLFLRRQNNHEREHHLWHHRMADDLVRRRRAGHDNVERVRHGES